MSRPRAYAAAREAKRTIFPESGTWSEPEDGPDEDEAICADCGAPHDACECLAHWEHEHTGPGHPGDPGRF